jgi:glycosyltransferase involved in cell wall biosynthesis
MKVLILTYYWPPAGGPGVQRWLKFCKYLPENGIDPIVITVKEQEATWPIRDAKLLDQVSDQIKIHSTSTFEPFELYLKTSGKKQVPYSGFANEEKKENFISKLAKFIRGNFFLPDARKGWNSFAYKKAMELLSQQEISAVISTGPPHSTHLIAKKLKRKTGIKWIADFRDPWTDIYYYKQMYPTLLSTYIDKRMERKVLRNSDVVLGSSPYLTELLSQKIKGDTSKFRFMPNGYDEEDFPNPRPEFERFSIVYAGTIGKIYPCHSLVDALLQLAERNTQWTFKLFGKADEEMHQLFGRLGELGFQAFGHIEHSLITKRMAEAEILLLVIPDQDPNQGIIPGKLFEYIGSGRKILGIGPVQCDAAKIVTETQSGRFFDYNDTA